MDDSSILLLLCWKEVSSAFTEKYPAAKSEFEATVRDLKRLLSVDNYN